MAHVNDNWDYCVEQYLQQPEAPIPLVVSGLPEGHLTLSDRLRAAIQKPLDGSRSGFIPLSKLHDIINETSVSQELTEAAPGTPFNVVQDKSRLICNEFRRVFAILSLLDRIQDMEYFIEDNVCDTTLPLVKISSAEGKPNLRPKLSQTTVLSCLQEWSPSLLDMFEDMQWKVLAASFLGSDHGAGSRELRFYSFDDKTVLPWMENNQHTSTIQGGFGKVFRVVIEPSHHNFNHPLSFNDVSENIDRADGTALIWRRN